MIPRHQLPVATRLPAGSLTAALGAALRARDDICGRTADALRRRHAADAVALTDSGTSALVVAFRSLRLEGKTVALPGYCCPDVVAAAAYVGARVRLYDLDPATLSPDLDDLSRALSRGVDAVVVTHLYGFAADVPGVEILARRAGVPVIEDAAQGAGGALAGRPLGSLSGISVLSFGRGKGLGGGGGGALLTFGSERSSALHALASASAAPAGWRGLVATAAQWGLGRPSIYSLPAALPFLRLGETVYHPATEPGPISRAAAAIALRALGPERAEATSRRQRAAGLRSVLDDDGPLRAISPIAGSEPGFLRFPVVDRRETGGPEPRLGILRGYDPVILGERSLREALLPGEAPGAGARELYERLLTLPTHHLVTKADQARLRAWLSSAAAGRPGGRRKAASSPLALSRAAD